MALARDNAGKIGASVGVTGISGAFTCTGSNLVLIAFAERDNGNVQTCTYNSVGMTLVGSGAFNPGSRVLDVFILANPATGSNTLASSGTGSTYRSLFAISYTGAQQTGIPDNFAFGTATTGTSVTVALTPVASGCWIAGMGMYDNGGTVTATNSAVIIGSTTSNPGGVNILFDTNTTVSGSTTMGTASTVSGGTNIFAISIAPVAAAGPTNLKSYDGNLKANIKSIAENLIANVKSLSGNS